MSPRDLKRNLFQSAAGQIFQRAAGMRMGKASCGACGRYVSETMSWRCGHCLETVDRTRFLDERGRPRLDEVMRHSVFGCCPHCDHQPPAVACPHCGHVNPLLDAPAQEQAALAATSAEEPPQLVIEEERDRREWQRRLEAAEAERRERIEANDRYTALVEAETRGMGAELARRMTERKLNPPEPKPPESPEEDVRQRLRRSTSMFEALFKAKDEQLADIKKNFADNPEALAVMTDVLDATVERMRVDIAQGK